MTVELPIYAGNTTERTLNGAVAASRSTFTGTDQVQDWGGQWWEYTIGFAARNLADGKRLSAFFTALGGMRTPFLYADPTIHNPTGIGSPAVNGAGQTGNSMVTDGWSAAGLKTGDFFSLGANSLTRLYMVTADVVPVAGAATIEFTPKLRLPTIDNEPLEVVAPKVLLRLTSPAPTSIGLADIYQFSLSAREAI